MNMKFIMLINVKNANIVGILTYRQDKYNIREV